MLFGVLVVIAAGLVFYGAAQREQKRNAARERPPPVPKPEPKHWLDRWKAAQRIHRD
jgi:hypothetical protein